MSLEQAPVTERFPVLKRTRDELKVQVALAKAEIKEEWQKAEVKWSRLEGEVERLRERAGDATHEVGTGIEHLATDVGESYNRIREALKRPV